MKSEKAMVVTESAESSGARRNESSASRTRSLIGRLGPDRRRRRRAVEHHAAVAQLDRAVGGLADQVEVVGGHDDHGAAGVDVAEQLEDAAGGALVEVAGRLVGQQDRRDRSPARARWRPAAARRRRVPAGRPAPWPRGRPGSARGVTRAGIVSRRAPVTSSAKATFSSAVRSSSRRKSWNTTPSRRRSLGISSRASVLDVEAGHAHFAGRWAAARRTSA